MYTKERHPVINCELIPFVHDADRYHCSFVTNSTMTEMMTNFIPNKNTNTIQIRRCAEI